MASQQNGPSNSASSFNGTNTNIWWHFGGPFSYIWFDFSKPYSNNLGPVGHSVIKAMVLGPHGLGLSRHAS